MKFPDTGFAEEAGLFFHDIDSSYSLLNQESIRKWIERVLKDEQKSLGPVHFHFCTDKSLLNINQEFLQHDDYTDIISFQYNDDPISGDIYISIERVKENANALSKLLEDELRRVLIHGILHFMGYKDKSSEEKLIMRQKEDLYLKLWEIDYA